MAVAAALLAKLCLTWLGSARVTMTAFLYLSHTRPSKGTQLKNWCPELMTYLWALKCSNTTCNINTNAATLLTPVAIM